MIVRALIYIAFGLFLFGCVETWDYCMRNYGVLVCVQVEQGKLAPTDIKCFK